MAIKPATITSTQHLTPRVAHECDNRNVFMAILSNNLTNMTKTDYRLKNGGSSRQRKFTAKQKADISQKNNEY